MTNGEAYKSCMAIAGDALKKIHMMKGFVKETNLLYKREHNIASVSIQNALVIAARCHKLKEDFFDDPVIVRIIENHPVHEEFQNWLKITSMGHL